jgi:hypothetical protein
MLARLLWFLSVSLLVCSNSQAMTLAEFDQEALAQPQRVEARLKQGITPEDKLLGQTLLKAGLQHALSSDQRDFGPFVKDFCASAVSYPTAQALMLCAEARAYFDKSMASRLSGVHQKDYLEKSLNNLSGLLASAEIAIKYTPVTQKELRAVQTASQCTRQFLIKRKSQQTCPPLVWLGLH